MLVINSKLGIKRLLAHPVQRLFATTQGFPDVEQLDHGEQSKRGAFHGLGLLENPQEEALFCLFGNSWRTFSVAEGKPEAKVRGQFVLGRQ